MEINRCVSCGEIIPEGDHICKQCFEESDVIKVGSIRENILVADEMLRMKLKPVTLSFNNFDVKIENSVTLLETLFKYYIFKTNMTDDGQFTYRFVWENIILGESVGRAADRLFSEYNDVVNTIESLIIKK